MASNIYLVILSVLVGKNFRLKDRCDLRMWFEEVLNRSPKKVEKQKKMRIRRKVRDEIFFLLTWGEAVTICNNKSMKG